MNNQFGQATIAEALETLAARSPAIEVAGVTDYAGTALYRQVADVWAAGGTPSIRMVFPNVELRLGVETKKGGALNLHLMCAPGEVDELDNFLALLEFRFDSVIYRGTPEDLARLGRAFRGDPKLDGVSALHEGALQFKPSFGHVCERFRESGWAHERCLVGVPARDADGSAGVRDNTGGWEATRREIERFAHVIFTSNPNDREFWLGRGVDSPEDLDNKYGGRKLCLHGSDAHKIEELGAPDGDRFTWLKGNASFETLVQAVIEPDLRSAIGSEQPDASRREGRICHIAVASDGWFPEQMQINPGLVAIIGPRGSGKTALADLLVAGTTSPEPFRVDRSFLCRAGDLVADTHVSLTWDDGEVTSSGLADLASNQDEPPVLMVRYLSQQFVERLCAQDGLSSELIDEIERVVFESWPVAGRTGASSFSDLREIRLSAARTAQRAHLEAIGIATDRLVDEIQKQRQLPNKTRLAKELQDTLVRLAKDAEVLTAGADKAVAPRLAAVSQALQHAQDDAQREDRELQSLRALRSKVETYRKVEFPNFTRGLREAHVDARLSEGDWQQFAVDFTGDVSTVLANAESATEVRLANRNGVLGPDEPTNLDTVAAEDLAKQPVVILQTEQRRLRELAGLDQKRAVQLEANERQRNVLTAQLTRTNAEIADAGDAQVRIGQVRVERLAAYQAYFDALLEEEHQLNELYGPLEEKLAAAGSSVARLKLAVRRVVDVRGWAEKGEHMFDLRKEGPFRLRGSLEKAARETLLHAWQQGDGVQAAAALDAFATQESAAIRQQAPDKGTDEDYREWYHQVSKWLYSADHVRLVYSLEYDGVDIERLSPGTRGVVLLLLYLAVDHEESVPLVIDQPEENLDPQSVYAELVQLFRDASERRQVIMVTHNANLVVNTDVDQVIVASCGPQSKDALPQFAYVAGGIEDSRIREEVCRVLEGGAAAFKERAKRLRVY
jgi:hypothetical protein